MVPQHRNDSVGSHLSTRDEKFDKLDLEMSLDLAAAEFEESPGATMVLNRAARMTGRTSDDQEDDIEDLLPSSPQGVMRKYTAAIAYFRRYDLDVPVRQCWERGLKVGSAYWKERQSDGDEMAIVAQQVRAALDDALKPGISAQTLAAGLGRVLARLQTSETFKPSLGKAMEQAASRLGMKGQVEAPMQMMFPKEGGRDEKYFTACEQEVVRGVLKELKLVNMFDSVPVEERFNRTNRSESIE